MTRQRYQVVETIGCGGFGTVYQARMTGSGGFSKLVALKVLNADTSGIGEFAKRLRDEARILGLIRHRSIVQVDRLIQLGGRWAVVMEYVAGANLSEIARCRPIPLRPALEIVRDVADALHVAYHTVGPDERPLHLLHRDIKLSNVQVTTAGEVKVLDFGIARADFDSREATTRDLHFGTHRYLSPERLDGIDTIQGDVYSLGVVLYEMLLGCASLKTSSNPERHAKHVEEAIEQVQVALASATDVPEAREQAVNLLRDLLAYKGADRPMPRELERRSAEVVACAAYPRLRDWSEDAVQEAISERASRVTAGELQGVELSVDTRSLIGPNTTLARIFAHSDAPTVGTAVMRRPSGWRTALLSGLAAGAVTAGIGLAFLVSRPQSTPPDPPVDHSFSSGDEAPTVQPTAAEPLPSDDLNAEANEPETEELGRRSSEHVTTEPADEPEDEPEEDEAKADSPEENESEEDEPEEDEPEEDEPEEDEPEEDEPEEDEPEEDEPEEDEPEETPTGTITASGADKVVLIGSQGTHSLGTVPAGTYEIQATFPGREPMNAGSVTVPEGGSVKLQCDPFFTRCKTQ